MCATLGPSYAAWRAAQAAAAGETVRSLGPAAPPGDALGADAQDAVPWDDGVPWDDAVPSDDPAPRTSPLDRAGFAIGDACPGPRDGTAAKLARALSDVLATEPALPARAPAAAPAPGAPRFATLVTDSLRLGATEKAVLAKRGLVTLERYAYADYTTALYEVYRRDLPLFIGVDAILHTAYVAHDGFLRDLEVEDLVGRTTWSLAKMHCGLPSLAPTLSAETQADLDLYITVARRLLEGREVPSALGQRTIEAEAAELVAAATRERGLAVVTLFGRQRMIDFHTFEPRGHYAGESIGCCDHQRAAPKEPDADADADGGPRLGGYFRALVWLSRITLNLESRGCQDAAPVATSAETDRELLLAFALTELASASHADQELAHIDEAWRALAGPGEAAVPAELATLRARSGVTSLASPGVAQRLRAEIAGRFPRHSHITFAAQGCGDRFAAVATLVAASVPPDATAMMALARADHTVDAAELGYALGHDRARRYLSAGSQSEDLDAARAALAAPPSLGLYGHWLGAITSLAETPSGVRPSLMAADAWADLRLGSALAAYAQLRKNHVLLATHTYSEDACEIPDAWVDPAPATYRALALFALAGADLAAERGLEAWLEQFKDMARIYEALAIIAEHELSGAPLTSAMQRFLAMVVEIHDSDGYGGAPTYDGWYFDLFLTGQRDAFFPAAVEADVFVAPARGEVVSIGARGPVLGVFTVDTGGAKRVLVGPVARAYQARRPIGDDHDAAVRSEPWRDDAAADIAPLPAAVEVTVETKTWRVGDELVDLPSAVAVTLTAGAGGRYTVELVGPNRRALASKRVALAPGASATLRLAMPKQLAAVHVALGEHHQWIDCATFEEMVECREERDADVDADADADDTDADADDAPLPGSP
jgi:hypothetical protein